MKALSIALLTLAAAASTQLRAQKAAPFSVAESGKSYATLQAAVRAIGDRKGTILIRPGTYRQCAVQASGSIIFRASIPGQVIFSGTVCEDKAAIVLRGQSARVDGIIFENMKSSDGNGAGLRLESGSLSVTRAIFRNSQQGILTAHDPASTLSVDQTTFSGLGICMHHCAHSIYGGYIAKLTVTRSRFERGTGGHYIKFRGRQVDINGNAFDDSRGSKTNYMIDLPNGATGRITHNIFTQGANKENSSTFIAIGAEEKRQTSNGLSISNNDARIATGVNRSTTFLADWSGDSINLGANRLGRGVKPFARR